METIVEDIQDMIIITAGYVREGVMFTCTKLGNGYWLIKLTGGF